jgi:type IX secretion system substrate protein
MKKFMHNFLIAFLLLGAISTYAVATPITVNLNNGDGDPINTGATLKYYDSNGWHTATNNNDGTFTADVNGTNITYKMYFNNGVQQKVESSSTNPVSFQTSTTLLSLKDSDGNVLVGDNVKYYQNGWSGDNATGTTVELLPGTYSFKMFFNNGTQQINGEVINGTEDEVVFTTVSTLLSLKDSDGNVLVGDNVKYYQNGWSGDNSTGTTVELLPGKYSFKMFFNNGTQQINGEVIDGAEDEVLFTTVTVNPKLVDCDDNPLSNGNVKFYQNGWSGNNTPNSTIELLPGTYSFKMFYNFATEQRNGVVIAGNSQDVTFSTTQINYVYGGTIKFYQNGWGTYTQGMHFLPGVYSFKFDNKQFNNFEVSGCSMDGNVNIFKTVKHDGTPLPNITIARNHYYSSYTNIGTTDANGILFTTDQPNGVQKYKATKDFSTQYIISGPNTITFQTSEFVTHVKHTDGSPFEGVKTEYNHYYSSYMGMSPSTTDANGNASIELFPGEYKFKATKDFSTQYKYLEITTPGTSAVVNFQTSTFVTHVMDHNGNPFEGIKTEYNHYYSSYMGLSPSTTDANGNASIELFPGEYKFKATKHYSTQTKMFEIPSSGVTASVDFQTALAEAHVKDCELNTGVAGVAVEYNHYYSSYMDLNPNSTNASGIASIELFPGTYKFKATIHNSFQTQTLAISGPVTTFEFNPTRVTLNYPGTVKYNHYYSSYMTIGDNTYLFPGTYNFRFYNGNTIAKQMPIQISGCSMNQALIFVQLKNSQNSGLAGGDFEYRYGYANYTNLGIDNSGNGYWTFIEGNPTNTQVKVKYKGAEVAKIQNVKTNPIFTFNTVDVSADLRNSIGELLTANTWEYRYGYGSYVTLNNSGEELLPVNTDVRVGYKGITVNKIQNVNTNSHFDFATVNVTADLKNSLGSDLVADSWEYRYGYGSYVTLNNSGEELLPVNTDVRVGYKGITVNKIQNVNTNSHFDFATVNVTADLKNSLGSDLVADSWEYRYGYGSYVTLNNSGEELLPVNTDVRVGYKGITVNKIQNVNTTPNFVFNTVNVTADLLDNATDISSSATWQYRYGYSSYHSFDYTGEELLPANTEVKVTYNATSKSKILNVGNTPDFHFIWNGNSIFKSTNDFDLTAGKVVVYPNPSDGRFMIDNVTNYFRLSVYDMTGKVVYQSDINEVNNHNIVLDNPVPGSYMIQLEGIGSTVTTPIMIK